MSNSLRYGWILLAQGVTACALVATSFSQQPRSPQMPAPPPMRFVSHDERSELNSAKDPKARLRAALSLAEGHLSQAETLTQQGKFDQASEELGSYLGLVDDARSSIAAINNDKSSTRDLYRHLDLALRLHVPRLAVMRRSTPVGYAVHLKTSEQFVQDIRTQAQDSFFGHTVLREPPANETKPEGQKGATDGPKRPQ